MSTISTECPECQQAVMAPASSALKEIECPACHHVFVCPMAGPRGEAGRADKLEREADSCNLFGGLLIVLSIGAFFIQVPAGAAGCFSVAILFFLFAQLLHIRAALARLDK